MENGLSEQEVKLIKIKVQHVRNKKITKIENIPSGDCDRVLDILKKKMACGGSKHADGTIQIQGDKTHTDIVNIIKTLVEGCRVEMNGRVS